MFRESNSSKEKHSIAVQMQSGASTNEHGTPKGLRNSSSRDL